MTGDPPAFAAYMKRSFKQRRKTYDPECEDFARRRLRDEQGVTEAHVEALAQHIQTEIEDWLKYEMSEIDGAV